LQLADPEIYQESRKDGLLKTLKLQKELAREEDALLKEWDDLTAAMEQVSIGSD